MDTDFGRNSVDPLCRWIHTGYEGDDSTRKRRAFQVSRTCIHQDNALPLVIRWPNMLVATSRVMNQGQISVPAEVRKDLGIRAGTS